MLCGNHLLNRRQDLKINYVPLSEAEFPHTPGFLCAIDAEFVAMNKV